MINESWCFTTCPTSPYLFYSGLPSDVNVIPTGCGCSPARRERNRAARATCACGSSRAADDPSKRDTPRARTSCKFLTEHSS